MSSESRDEHTETRRTRAVVDRIEDGGAAVLFVGEDEGAQVELPASLLPEGAASGSHLLITVALDEGARRDAEDRVRALQEKLERRGGQKNFKL
ncbi:MAG TPA: DUF3006 domain-containing protein [Pyrinomonadaceae bacterium]|jgi:hypothetical protein